MKASILVVLSVLLLLAGVPARAQDAGEHLITSVVVSSPETWEAGGLVVVTMTGRPGGQATFDLGPVQGIALYEGPPGTYRGTYVLTPADAALVNPVVIGHLHMPGGETGVWRPSPGVPLAVTVNTGDVATLAPGQTFQVTVRGPAGGLATFDVGSHAGLPMAEVAPGVYVGSYTVQPGDASPAYVQAHVTVAGSPQTSAAPQPVYFTAGGGLQLESITTPNAGPVLPGQTVSVTAIGTPGTRASFTVGGVTLSMAEVSPGTYVGNYPVPVSAVPGSLPVSVTLQDATGRVLTQPAPFAFSVAAGPGASPAAGPVTIDAPTMRSDVAPGFTVSGRTTPGAVLHVQVFVTPDEVPGGTLVDQQFEARLYAGQDGTFDVPVVLNGAQPGQHLDVRVQTLDAGGAPVGQDEVVVTLR